MDPIGAPVNDDCSDLAALNEGDRDAGRRLYDRHAAVVFALCRAESGARPADDAEDAVQEAFLQAVRDLRKWKPTAPLEAWLVTITVRTAQKVDQRSNRVASRSDSLDAPLPDGNQRELRDQAASTDPAAAAGRADLASRLAAAIADLPDKYRTAVTLRFQEGLSPKEIAEHLGLPERTVRTQLQRGLGALRERMEGLE